MQSNNSKKINRAEVVNDNFLAFVENYQPSQPKSDLATNGLDQHSLWQLFESQVRSRQLDLMARVLKLQNKVFYTAVYCVPLIQLFYIIAVVLS